MNFIRYNPRSSWKDVTTSRCVLFSLPAMTVALGAFARTNPPPAASRTSATASRAVGFQPGVRIDWNRRQIELDGRIVLRQGQLELFACTGGAKAHESIVELAARPLHLYQALGLLGLEPGRPGWWDAERDINHPPTGDAVTVLVRWNQSGRERTASACDWMENLLTEKPLEHTHWLFTGSQKLPEGLFAADLYGTVITVVDFDTAVLTMVPPRSPPPATKPGEPQEPLSSATKPAQSGGQHLDGPADIPLAALTQQIPPLGTPVTVIIRPAISAGTQPKR